MIIVRIYGGLGNQMFQYAFGRSLSLQYNSPLFLDLSWFDLHAASDRGCLRPFRLDTFPALSGGGDPEIRQKFTAECRRFTEPSLTRRAAVKLFGNKFRIYVDEEIFYAGDAHSFTPPLYMDGYWQNINLWSKNADAIKKDFTFGAISDNYSELSKEIINNDCSIAMHIRRGDYLEKANINSIGICDLQYYIAAINHIKKFVKDPFFYIFSEDKEYPLKIVEQSNIRHKIIIGNDAMEAYHDMHLMSLCRHHIIANSTFSWWGAYLSTRNGITIIPRQWFVTPPSIPFGVHLPDWIRI